MPGGSVAPFVQNSSSGRPETYTSTFTLAHSPPHIILTELTFRLDPLAVYLFCLTFCYPNELDFPLWEVTLSPHFEHNSTLRNKIYR